MSWLKTLRQVNENRIRRLFAAGQELQLVAFDRGASLLILLSRVELAVMKQRGDSFFRKDNICNVSPLGIKDLTKKSVPFVGRLESPDEYPPFAIDHERMEGRVLSGDNELELTARGRMSEPCFHKFFIFSAC